MDGIPAALPALVLAAKLERQAAGAGLGWDATGEPSGAVRRAAEELRATDAEAFGELFFELARLAAGRGVDAEEVLRRSAQRFRTRFAAAERLAAADGTTLAAANGVARRAYWEAAGST